MFFNERKSKISNVRYAIPPVAAPSIRPVVAPDEAMLKLFYEEKKERITNIKSALPDTLARGPAPPPPPATFTVLAVPEMQAASSLPPPPPPPPLQDLKGYKPSVAMDYYLQYELSAD